MFRWNRQNIKELLAAVFDLEKHKEDFLGVSHSTLPSPETMLQDIAHVQNYSLSSDYKIYAHEVWSKVINCIDRLSDPKETQTDFYRGELKANLDNLRIAYNARNNQQRVKKQMEAKARPPVNGRINTFS